MSLVLGSQTISPAAVHVADGYASEGAENGRILIVDDSSPVRGLFRTTLSERYECAEAGSYEEAMECLKAAEFDLVITDIIMPGLSGIELLRKVLESYPHTPVIIVSGVDRSQRALDALRLGASDYLIKPCELPVLEMAVERALERRTLMIKAEKYKEDLEIRNAELTKGKAQLQQLQGRLVQHEKMASLGQIAAGIAHELNNPIASVYGNLDILREVTLSLVKMLDFYENAPLPPEIADEAAAIRGTLGHLTLVDECEMILADCREGTERVRDIVQNLRTFLIWTRPNSRR